MSKISEIAGSRRFPYNLWELLSVKNWWYEFKYDRQRKQRGWSDKDTWAGGEHIASVCSGILEYLQSEKTIVDWEAYFEMNFEDNYGYSSLNEVAKDIDNYLAWQEESFSSPIWDELGSDDYETRLAVEYQLYADYKNAMHFVAENIGGLWW